MFYSRLIIVILNFFDYFQQKKIIELIKKKFARPLVIFDVGAHHGETIRLFRKKLKIEKIYSFEPSPKNFEILDKNISKFDKNKVEIFNFGFGDKNSENFINQTLESSSSTINKFNEESNYFKKKLKILNIKSKNSFYYQLPIIIKTLDDFIEKKQIEYIDLLKIDTEGYELNVLKGLSKNNRKIKLIYFEHHYDDMIIKNYKFKDINKLLKSYGFIKIKKSKMLFRKSFEYIYENSKIDF